MTSKTGEINGVGPGGLFAVDRHFGDLEPVYAGAPPTAANEKARGAADRMWNKVRDDLDRIEHSDSENWAESEETDDE